MDLDQKFNLMSLNFHNLKTKTIKKIPYKFKNKDKFLENNTKN